MKHPQDSHRYLDPYEVWKRVMRVEIPKAAWEEIQRSHFTYWYMPHEAPRHVSAPRHGE